MANRSKFSEVISELLVGCVLTCAENAKTVLALAIVLAGMSATAAGLFLSVNTDTAKMIDTDLQFRERFAELLKAFPEQVENLIVVVDADDPETATQATRALVASFESRPDLYSDVYAPEVDPFFERHGMLYLSEAELQQVAGRLQAGVPLLVPLAQDPTLRGLSQFLQIIGYSAQQGAQLQSFVPLLSEFDRVFRARAAGDAAFVEWGAILAPGETNRGNSRKFISIHPVLDFTSLEPAERALAEAKSLVGDPDVRFDGKVRVHLTGDIVLNAEELRSVSDGAVLAGVISLILVSLVMTFGVRSWRIVVASLLTLIIGLVMTAGFATAAVGYLNLISVAFAVLFVGLGIDFAIHFCLRFEEEIRRGMPRPVAFANTADGVGGALAVCTGAAAVGFLAFTPTSFVGMAQLGMISAAGMVIAFVTSITVLPALLSLLPLPRRAPPKAAAPQGEARPGRWRIGVVVATMAACAVAVFFLPQIRFDGDPIRLKDPDSASVKTYLELFENGNTSPYQAQVMVGSDAEAAELSARLTELPEVSRVISIFSFLPDAQERKLPVVRQLRTAMRQVPIQPAQDIGDAARVEALQTMTATLGQLAALPDEAFKQSVNSFAAAIEMFVTQHGSNPKAVRVLERSLFAKLKPTIEQINHAAAASEVTVATVPANIRDRYISKDGALRLEVFPQGNVSDDASMRAFADAVLAVAPRATGSPIEVTGAADVVVKSMLQATSIAGGLILIVLLLTLRRIVDVILVLIPIVMAGTLTLATTVWFDTPFNFANVIVLPLLIGLGVAGGIHLVVRSRRSYAGVALLRTNTPRAVLLSALTTIGSFASLAISKHQGMASMGILLTVSIAFTLICTLIVLPNLIRWFTGRTA